MSRSGYFVALGMVALAPATGGNDGCPGSIETKVVTVASTIPANGDLNPYGVAVVPVTRGILVAHEVLVSNFNNAKNQQGTGSTIVAISPSGSVRLFARIDPAFVAGKCPGGVGLTTALVALRSGLVIVGSLPTADGTAATAQPGCLIVLNSRGQVISTLSGSEINGPWDMTALDRGHSVSLFVTNVLNGTVEAGGSTVNQGTVLRIDLQIEAVDAVPTELGRVVIGSGFGARTDPEALVIGPTGVGLAPDGTLYVADTLANRIVALPSAVTRPDSAGIGATVSQGGALNGPLGLAVSPAGFIFVTNGGDGNIVEVTRVGVQAAVFPVDTTGSPPGAGTLFGLAVAPDAKRLYFVNDGDNTLRLLQ